MKADKKLKNLIKKQSDEIKAGGAQFFDRMVSTYYAEEKKPAFNFFSRKVMATFACVLVLALTVTVGIGYAFRNKAQNTAIGNNGQEIHLPDNTERVERVRSQELNVEDLEHVEWSSALSFGSISVALPTGVEVYESKADDRLLFHYATGATEEGFFRLQLVEDASYEYISRLTQKTRTVNVSQVKFKYSVLFAENERIVYFFAEAVSGDQTLLIDYTTDSTDCERSFLAFLNSIIL